MTRNKTAEMSMAVLDVMDSFIVDFQGALQDAEGHNDFMALVFEVFCQLLSTDQSKVVVERLLQNSLKALAMRFSGLFFAGSPEYSGEL